MTADIAAHKSHLLETCYDEVTAVVDDLKAAMTAQQALAAQRPDVAHTYPDLIANLAMQVPDDLCLMQTAVPLSLIHI